MADNEISVDLKLQLDQLSSQTKAAGAQINKDLASSVKGLKPTSVEQESAARAREKSINREAQEAKRKDAMEKDRMREQAKQAAEERKEKLRVLAAEARKLAEEARMRREVKRFEKNNPNGKEAVAEEQKSSMRMFGQAAYTAGFSGFRFFQSLGGMNIALLAVVAELEIVKAAVDKFGEAVSRGAQAYSRNISSGGLGLAFTVKRSALADVLGVGEQDVYNYASAFGNLNERLAIGTNAIISTAPELASVAHAWRIFQYDMDALVSQLAVTMAPMIRRMITALDDLVKMGIYFAKTFPQVVKDAFMGAIAVMTQPWVATFLSAASVGMKEKDPGPAPSVNPNTNRLASSMWEKMGLVVKGTREISAADRTARNTDQMVRELQKLNTRISKDNISLSGFDPSYSYP